MERASGTSEIIILELRVLPDRQVLPFLPRKVLDLEKNSLKQKAELF
jgi:hypothetical protein